ncbi:hypothetical protein ACJX0J_014862 [Zea mays]
MHYLLHAAVGRKRGARTWDHGTWIAVKHIKKCHKFGHKTQQEIIKHFHEGLNVITCNCIIVLQITNLHAIFKARPHVCPKQEALDVTEVVLHQDSIISIEKGQFNIILCQTLGTRLDKNNQKTKSECLLVSNLDQNQYGTKISKYSLPESLAGDWRGMSKEEWLGTLYNNLWGHAVGIQQNYHSGQTKLQSPQEYHQLTQSFKDLKQFQSILWPTTTLELQHKFSSEPAVHTKELNMHNIAHKVKAQGHKKMRMLVFSYQFQLQKNNLEHQFLLTPGQQHIIYDKTKCHLKLSTSTRVTESTPSKRICMNSEASRCLVFGILITCSTLSLALNENDYLIFFYTFCIFLIPYFVFFIFKGFILVVLLMRKWAIPLLILGLLRNAKQHLKILIRWFFTAPLLFDIQYLSQCLESFILIMWLCLIGGVLMPSVLWLIMDNIHLLNFPISTIITLVSLVMQMNLPESLHGEYDLSGFAVGVVKKDKIIDGKNIVKGDVCLCFNPSYTFLHNFLHNKMAFRHLVILTGTRFWFYIHGSIKSFIQCTRYYVFLKSMTKM